MRFMESLHPAKYLSVQAVRISIFPAKYPFSGRIIRAMTIVRIKYPKRETGGMIDELDGKVLAQLQKDSRQSNQQLADRVGMSASACWRRVDALETTGIVARYTALVDREKAGFSMSAILHVSLDRHDEKFVTQFVSRVRRRPEVLECFATTGDADYHLRVVVSDMAAYNRFLDDFMFKIPGLRHVRTNVILKEIKYDVALPF